MHKVTEFGSALYPQVQNILRGEESPKYIMLPTAVRSFNGFENTRRQDYFHKEFGLILADMHDENVIAKEDVLFFIDTVFYITASSIQ